MTPEDRLREAAASSWDDNARVENGDDVRFGIIRAVLALLDEARAEATALRAERDAFMAKLAEAERRCDDLQLELSLELSLAFAETAEVVELLTAGHPSVDSCLELACVACAVRDCPSCDPMHYHHEGCPSCKGRCTEEQFDQD